MTNFIAGLRKIADEFKPFIDTSRAGSLSWNGVAYVKRKDKLADPYGLAWWSSLTTMADLLEAQESTLSAKQFDYLERVLFGGMGSLNDFWLNEDIHGEEAKNANNRIREQTTQLFGLFKLLRTK
jgi:hypothetical protein